MSEMKTVRTSELIGAPLDWAVAKIEGVETLMMSPRKGEPKKPFALFGSLALALGGDGEQSYAPSACWHCGGPLIEKYKLDIGAPMESVHGPWNVNTEWGHPLGQKGETPLIAACRAIVAANLGDEVQIPAELLP